MLKKANSTVEATGLELLPRAPSAILNPDFLFSCLGYGPTVIPRLVLSTQGTKKRSEKKLSQRIILSNAINSDEETLPES